MLEDNPTLRFGPALFKILPCANIYGMNEPRVVVFRWISLKLFCQVLKERHFIFLQYNKKVLEHTTPPPHCHTYLPVNINPCPEFSGKNEPSSSAVGCGYRAPMNWSIQLWVRPFISFLTCNEEPDSAEFCLGSRLETPHVSSFVAPYRFFHHFNLSSAHSAMLGPILVSFALFVFLPVTAIALVSASAFPYSGHLPRSHRVSCDEWAFFGF